MAVLKKRPIAATLEEHLSGEKPLDVSQSVINCWRRCQMKYNYRYVQLLERKKPFVYFQVGSMIGECLDAIALRRGNPKAPHWESVLEKYKRQYKRLWEAEREYYGDPIAEVRRIVTRYERIYADDGFTYLTDKESGKPYELTGRVELAPGIIFTFHIDKMAKDRHGRIWIIDHKSFKNIPGPDDRMSAMQLVFYYKAAPLCGYPQPTGVIWDYLRKKAPTIPEELKRGGLSQRANMDTDYETYLAEVRRLKLNERDYASFLKDLKSRGHMDFYQRIQLPAPNKDLIQNVWNDALASAIQIRDMGKTAKVRSIDKTCKSCEFHSLCQAEYMGLDSDGIRKSEYQRQKEIRHAHHQEEE